MDLRRCRSDGVVSERVVSRSALVERSRVVWNDCVFTHHFHAIVLRGRYLAQEKAATARQLSGQKE